MTFFRRREALFFLASPFWFDCGPPPKQGITVVAPTMKSNAKMHAFTVASTSFAFMSGHAYSWPRFLEPLSTDGYALLEALRAKGYGLQMEVTVQKAASEDSVDGVNVEFGFPKKGEHRKEHPDPVAVLDGVDAIVLHKGRIALFAVVAMTSQLNSSNDILQRRAFALLVLREKIKKGEKADWADPNRPAEESLADIELALRLIADHYAQIQTWRSRVLAMVALIHAFDQPGGMEALKAAVTRAKSDSQAWLATHLAPTVDDFGIGMEALPEPEPLVKKLDIDLGIVAAAIQTAQGIATGSAQMTLEGLSKLAPKDSTAATALAGLAAASKGDVMGVVDAVAKLSGKEEEVNAIKAELAPFQALAKKTGVL